MPNSAVSSDRVLSIREEQVLNLLATAAPNQVIASELGIKVNTVKRHVLSICDKTGMGNRIELALFRVHQQHLAELAEVHARYTAA